MLRRRVPIAPKPAPRFKARPVRFCASCFTRFERELLRATFQDPSVKGSAAILGTTISTVKFYRAQICSKFGVPNFECLLVYLLSLWTTGPVHAVTVEHRTSRPDRRVFNRRYQARYQASYREEHRKEIRDRARRTYQRSLEENRKMKRENARKSYYAKRGLPVPAVKRAWTRRASTL